MGQCLAFQTEESLSKMLESAIDDLQEWEDECQLKTSTLEQEKSQLVSHAS